MVAEVEEGGKEKEDDKPNKTPKTVSFRCFLAGFPLVFWGLFVGEEKGEGEEEGVIVGGLVCLQVHPTCDSVVL